MPVIFLISAAFHCALILAVLQVHGGGRGKSATFETVIEVGLVGLADRSETAAALRDAGKKAPGPQCQRESLPKPLSTVYVDTEKGKADVKKKNRAVRAKTPGKAQQSAADTGGTADYAPILTAEAPTSPGAAGLSQTASNQCMDSPPDSHPENPGKSGTPESASGHPKISAALQGTGKEDARKGYLIENFLYIKNRITRHLTYPAVARRLKWQGIAVVTFYILENGLVENIEISSSSGHQLLDNHVIDTVKRLQPFPRPPVRAAITIPVKYILSE